MSSTKAEAEIILKADRFKQGKNEVNRGFKEIQTQGTNSMNALETETNQTTQSVRQLGMETQKTSKLTAESMISIVGLAQGVTGLNDAILGFAEKQVALERSQFGLKETTEDLKRAQEDLKEMMADSETPARDLERAMKDLTLLQENYNIELKEVKAEQAALNGEYMSFALSAVQTGFFGYTAINSMLSDNQKAAIAARFANASLNRERLKSIPASISSTLSAKASAIAHLGLAGSLRAAAAAMKAFMLSNPVTAAALIASTAAVAAYESNLLGMRDGIEDLTGMERGSLPTLTGAIMGTQGATEDVTKSLSEAEKITQDLQKQFDNLGYTVSEDTTPALEEFGRVSERTTGQSSSSARGVQTMVQYWQDLAEAIHKGELALTGFRDAGKGVLGGGSATNFRLGTPSGSGGFSIGTGTSSFYVTTKGSIIGGSGLPISLVSGDGEAISIINKAVNTTGSGSGTTGSRFAPKSGMFELYARTAGLNHGNRNVSVWTGVDRATEARAFAEAIARNESFGSQSDFVLTMLNGIDMLLATHPLLAFNSSSIQNMEFGEGQRALSDNPFAMMFNSSAYTSRRDVLNFRGVGIDTNAIINKFYKNINKTGDPMLNLYLYNNAFDDATLESEAARATEVFDSSKIQNFQNGFTKSSRSLGYSTTQVFSQTRRGRSGGTVARNRKAEKLAAMRAAQSRIRQSLSFFGVNFGFRKSHFRSARFKVGTPTLSKELQSAFRIANLPFSRSILDVISKAGTGSLSFAGIESIFQDSFVRGRRSRFSHGSGRRRYYTRGTPDRITTSRRTARATYERLAQQLAEARRRIALQGAIRSVLEESAGFLTDEQIDSVLSTAGFDPNRLAEFAIGTPQIDIPNFLNLSAPQQQIGTLSSTLRPYGDAAVELLNASSAIQHFSGVRGEDSRGDLTLTELQSLFLKSDGTVNNDFLRTLNDRAAFLNLDRLVLTAT